jgi:Tfp pilus assembly protein PilZ
VPRLKLHLVDRTDLAKYIDPTADGIGGFFVPGAPSVGVGEKVTLEIVIQGGPRVLLVGGVAWRRATGDARTRPGVGVAIDGTEQSKVDYLLGYVRGGMVDAREKRRLPIRLRVAYEGARARRINFTRDLNEEGAFVRCSELLEVGARTTLMISPPGAYKPLTVRALVTRRHEAGPDRGVGVQFEFEDGDERARMVAFVDKLEQDYLDGKLPDEALL